MTASSCPMPKPWLMGGPGICPPIRGASFGPPASSPTNAAAGRAVGGSADEGAVGLGAAKAVDPLPMVSDPSEALPVLVLASICCFDGEALGPNMIASCFDRIEQ